MKKLALIFLTVVCTAGAYAQKAEPGDRQITLGIQGNNGYVIYKHYYKEGMARRFGITGGLSYSKNFRATPEPGFETTSHSTSLNYGLSIGVQKSFTAFEKLEPFIGIDLGLSNYYQKSHYEDRVTDSTLTNYRWSGDFYKNTSVMGWAPSLSLKPLIGLNYYLHKNFAIGVEYMFNVLSVGYSFEGKNNFEQQYYGKYSARETKTPAGFSFSNSFSGYGGITVSYFFK